jgi:hypothetical protein
VSDSKTGEQLILDYLNRVSFESLLFEMKENIVFIEGIPHLCFDVETEWIPRNQVRGGNYGG